MQCLRFSCLNCRVFSFQGPIRYTCSISKYIFKNVTFASNRSFHNSLRISGTFPQLLHSKLLSTPLLLGRSKQTSTNQEKTPQQALTNQKNVESTDSEVEEQPPENLSLFQRYKKMLREYWYVLLPVHMVTSALWFGGFYYAATQGLDIVPFLEYLNLPEALIKPLRNSSLGYIAAASAIYKLATPVRYMVTLGGTTFAIKILTKRGLIRPAPSRNQFQTMLKNKFKKENASEVEK